MVVVPGDLVGYEEEVIPEFGVYSDEGNLYSSNIGELEKDMKKREVKVKVLTRIPMFYKSGMTVYGRIAKLTDNVAIIDILPSKSGNFEYIPRPTTHILPVSEVKKGFVKTLRDEFKTGDIIKARILEFDKYRVTLGTKSSDLGVVKAFCSHCRHELVLDKGVLKCPSCGSVERRKISIEYGKVGGLLYEAEGSRRKG